MPPTLRLVHERVDDVLLILGFLIQLRLPQLLDNHLKPHPHHRGEARRTTVRPTGSWVLSAIAREEITATEVDDGEERCWHLSPLPEPVLSGSWDSSNGEKQIS